MKNLTPLINAALSKELQALLYLLSTVPSRDHLKYMLSAVLSGTCCLAGKTGT